MLHQSDTDQVNASCAEFKGTLQTNFFVKGQHLALMISSLLYLHGILEPADPEEGQRKALQSALLQDSQQEN